MTLATRTVTPTRDL
ncbi:hypothetical protein E2C01_093277 [Portunus trituberculatus]|uniref:Uncharacterized protein n=1 Tax=Portunus trituberculatus TaxID=210409 RepID=A0A5B7JPC7_PORTR|nr:hypothetical protein [Portunus trituberculatus]